MTIVTKTTLKPEDMYFWLGEDAELEAMNYKQFEARINAYEKMIAKRDEQQPRG